MPNILFNPSPAPILGVEVERQIVDMATVDRVPAVVRSVTAELNHGVSGAAA